MNSISMINVPMRMNLGGSNPLLGGGAPSMAFDGRDGHHHNRRHPSSLADPSASTGAPALFNHNGSENHPQSTNLNILNQASSISQLSANNTSFDPAHQLNINEASQEEGSVLTAFSGLAVHTTSASNHTGGEEIIRRRPSSSSSNGPPVTSQYRLASSPPLPPQHQVFVQTTAMSSPATTIATNSSNAHAPTAVSPPPAVMFQQATTAAAATPHHQHMVHQQHPVTFHSSSSSNVNQPPHSYLQPKPIQNGRIPATKHDNRKLFVGGLPNEGKGSQIIICRCSFSIFLQRV